MEFNRYTGNKYISLILGKMIYLADMRKNKDILLYYPNLLIMSSSKSTYNFTSEIISINHKMFV